MAVHLDKISELLPVKGVQVAACSAGIYKTKRKDLALISFSQNSNCAAVFTQNAFCAAPVVIARNHLHQGSPKFCLINSGNANAGLGDIGIEAAMNVCRHLADHAGTNVESILPFSTGVIAEPLPVDKINNAIPTLVDNLREDAWNEIAESILTTDTLAKGISKRLSLPEGEITITGIAKGSGMIRPDMATMLAFIATDAKIKQSLIQGLLNEAVDKSFNCINVDGDTSTNDACFLVSTGESSVAEIKSFDEGSGLLLKNALLEICIYLAQAVVRDGEGATKFISISVTEGISEEECREVALAIANSPLVKTAFFASDPNWGRILAAIGRTTLSDLDIEKISISLDDVKIVESGQRAEAYTEADGQRVMHQEEVTVHISLGRGIAKAIIWTCDLSHEYVRINSEYRS
ncbi:MAG: glutamate N-acetyltransferase/amino-acid N-acetyltransferase [Gammaproteobacteria bacterium]|jgi:glutamate N-acetyltransferase/amino-acid N-acetyltransferase